MAEVIRIAMWSGPRNISTAMMRAWENRPDTAVWDEPFYACFLQATGIDHPEREAIIARYQTDWRRVVEAVLGPVPGGRRLFYQKHMTHHMLPEIGCEWFAGMRHAFLIRDPILVVASYVQKRSEVTPADIGLEREAAIYDAVVAATGSSPPIVDAADVLADPDRMLRRLTAALDVPFDAHMLSWPAGRRATDGIWGQHWYGAVEASTGFAAPSSRVPALSPEYAAVAAAAEGAYRRLHALRLT
ncbi:MAG: HAD family hydrolase [Alphaproteobacteria bacterium]|nr:HAD family hydrolase [Alphaproteobacteria bacterium]